MREYGQIQSSYWTHPDIRDLPIETKTIGAYLLTCQHTNGIGCFRMPIGYVSLDLSIGIETVSKGFEELFQKGFLEYDKPSEYVLIPNFLRWNPISNPNSAKARAKEFEVIPSSISIYPSVIKALQENGKYWSDDFKEKLKTLLEGFRNPIERVPADVRDNRPYPTLPKPDPEQDQNKTLSAAKDFPVEVDSREGENSETPQPPPAAAGIIAPTGFEETQPLVSVLAKEGFSHDRVHIPKSMITIQRWVKDGLTPENLSAVIAMTKSRNPDKAITSPLYLDGPVKDFLQAQNSDSSPNFGDWAVIPTDENQLWTWAKKHGYPDPGRTEKTRDYKSRLIRCVMDRKREFTESHKAKEG
ncbi:MAG: hypothetical protein N0E44_18820 [Candidatus Thiodiazotropha lotti]|nr:hypothetical protein [Candidatus Thiodiazotropha lotti]MCW4221938.1 hypothetical protein [Candidatus Thiodiazotropha lotti]